MGPRGPARRNRGIYLAGLRARAIDFFPARAQKYFCRVTYVLSGSLSLGLIYHADGECGPWVFGRFRPGRNVNWSLWVLVGRDWVERDLGCFEFFAAIALLIFKNP